MKSQESICHFLGESMGEADKKLFSFVLVSAMQSAFLANQYGDAMISYPMNSTSSRTAFITSLINMLAHGIKTEPPAEVLKIEE